MKILAVATIRDGGTQHIVTDEGEFYIANIMTGSRTGCICEGYPTRSSEVPKNVSERLIKAIYTGVDDSKCDGGISRDRRKYLIELVNSYYHIDNMTPELKEYIKQVS